MPQHKSAIKRMRQSATRAKRNRVRRSKMRNLIKNVLSASKKTEAEEQLKPAISHIDKMASKGVIHANNAARKKARLIRHINNL